MGAFASYLSFKSVSINAAHEKNTTFFWYGKSSNHWHSDPFSALLHRCCAIAHVHFIGYPKKKKKKKIERESSIFLEGNDGEA